MKKILLLLIAVALLTSCSAKNAGEYLKNNSINIIKGESTLSGPLTEEELFKKMEGYYFSVDYVEKFKTTKSAVDAENDFAAMIFKEHDGKYGVMQMDCHQGGGISFVEKVEYDGKGSYIVSFKDGSEHKKPFDLELIYTPESSKVHCNIKTEARMWKIKNKELDFYKYDKLESLYLELGKSIFGGYTGTFVEDNRVGFEYEDKVYEVSVLFDTEDPNLDNYNADGYIWITNASDKEEIFGMYTCDGQVLTIYNEDGNIFAVFRKPKI